MHLSDNRLTDVILYVFPNPGHIIFIQQLSRAKHFTFVHTAQFQRNCHLAYILR